MRAERQRLDKWLWFARFARTRALAVRLIGEGHVRINGKRAEAPAKPVAVGDIATVAAAHGTWVVRILDLGSRRGPAAEARQLYEEVGPAGEPKAAGQEGSSPDET